MYFREKLNYEKCAEHKKKLTKQNINNNFMLNVFKEAKEQQKKRSKMYHNSIVNTPCHYKAHEIEQERSFQIME